MKPVTPEHAPDVLVMGATKAMSYGPRIEPYDDGIVMPAKSAEDAEFWAVYEWRPSKHALEGGRWEWIANCGTEDVARRIAEALVRESDAQVPVAATLDEAAADPALTLDVARELLRDAAAGTRSLAASATSEPVRELYAHLLDMLGAKDHEDAARIIAQHHVREIEAGDGAREGGA